MRIEKKLATNMSSGINRRLGERSSAFLICCLIVIIAFALRSGRGFEYTTDLPVEAESRALADGEVCEQMIPDGAKTIRVLSVKFGVSGIGSEDRLKAVFLKNGEAVKTWEVDTDYLPADNYWNFVFDRPLKVGGDDHCSFTVSRISRGEGASDGRSGLSVRLAEGGSYTSEKNCSSFTTTASSEEDSSGQEDSGESAGGRFLCYRLTLLDGKMRARNIAPFIVTLVLLGIFAAVLIDFRRAGVLRLVLLSGVVFLFLETFTIDLMRRIVTDIPVRPFSQEYEKERIEPGEEWEDTLELRRVDFSSLGIPVGKGEDQSTGIRLMLADKSSGTVLVDRDIEQTDFTGEGPTGKMIRITADGENAKGLFPRGTYLVRIRNTEDSRKLRIGVEMDREGNIRLNYQARRESELGYRIAWIVLFLLGACLIAVFVISTAEKFSVSRFFIVSVVPLSIVYLILFVPWSIPDGGSHILATCRFSNIIMGADKTTEWTGRMDDADLFPATEELHDERNPAMKEYAEIYLNGRAGVKDRTKAEIGVDEKMKTYFPTNYLPQIIGVTIGKILGLGTVPMLYLARILTIIAYIAGCLHAVRTAPVGKVIFASTALLPSALMAGCSITYDAMVLISTLCFTASILRARHEPENRAALIETAVWAVVIGSVKGGGYLILLPLIILLFTGDFSKSAKKAAPILAAGLLSALIFDVLLSAGGLFQLGGTAAGKLSFSYAITHPLNYLDLMLRSYATFANSLSFGIGGSRMGWAEKDVIPDIMIAGLLVSAGVMSVFEKDRFSFTKRDRNVFLGIIALIVFTMPAMLLSWTSAGSDMIMGLQGRYFLPVLPLIFFVFTKFTVRVRTDSSRERITGIGRKYMIWFAVLSCLCVYFMMRLYLTR